MSMDEVIDRLKSDKEEMNRWVGVYIGLLAVLLAICNVGGANATKDMLRTNIEASNSWAFFQAKTIRRTTYILAADEMHLLLLTQPTLPPAAKKAVEDKATFYRSEGKRMAEEEKEGTKALSAKARELEVERDIALRKDPYFDWSQALIQIAIVLASVHLIIGNLMLLGLSGGLAGLGILLMINGFTLLVRLPVLG